MSNVPNVKSWYECVYDSDYDIAPDLPFIGEPDTEIAYRMTHSCDVPGEYNVSFGEYMRAFEQSDPDLYVLTANSAIPVADSIRGWFDVTGDSLPQLEYIRADSKLSSARHGDKAQRQAIIDGEVARFEAYAGARAAIIDQYSFTGSTIALAHRTLERAGLTVVGSTTDAKWYNHARGQVDLQAMTSEYAATMRQIGRDAVYRSSAEYIVGLYE